MKTLALLAGLLGLASAAPVEKRADNWWYADQDHSLSNSGFYNNVGDVVVSVPAGDAGTLSGAVSSNNRPDFTDTGDKWISGAPRVIYLPPGTYELDSTLYMYTDTVILGDASSPPTIKPSGNFNGDKLIVGGRDSDGNGGETHFSVAIKNVILDTTSSSNDNLIALHWRIAQNCHLSNVQINLPEGKHTGLYLGQGSTISVSDVTFSGGAIGFDYEGHQQAELKGLTFNNIENCIQISGGNSIGIIGNKFTGCKSNVINVTGPNAHIALIDATVASSGTILTVNGDDSKLNFIIENLDVSDGSADIVNINGQTNMASKSHVDTYVYGNLAGADYQNGGDNVRQTSQQEEKYGRPTKLAPNGRYPIIKAPTYKDKTKGDVVNVRDKSQNGNRNIAGDNSNDDTQGLQEVLNDAASAGKVVFFPAGVYKVTDTLTIPPGSQIIGEAWATISGFDFGDDEKAVVRVGEPNSSGTASISDLRFTVHNEAAGAIILQVNMNGANAGDVAIHNSLITLGGTSDTGIDCSDEGQCKAALYGLHLAKGSSAYIDNFWSWVADHFADNANFKGTRSAGKYGVVVGATDATWLAGIGSEHWWNAQIFYNNAENVLTTFFQSETNYNQLNKGASAQVPQPFGASGADPDYSWCNGDAVCLMGANEYWTGGKNQYHYTAGSYNFNDGSQGNINVAMGTPANWQVYGLTDHAAYANLKVGEATWGGDGNAPYNRGGWDGGGSVIAAYVDARQANPA